MKQQNDKDRDRKEKQSNKRLSEVRLGLGEA